MALTHIICVALVIGVSQISISTAQICSSVADIAIVIDHSGSIKQDPQNSNWNLIRQFLVTIVDNLDIGPDAIRLAAVGFSNKGFTHFRFDDSQDKSVIRNELSNLQWADGNTNTTGGLWVTRTQVFNPANGERPEVRDIMILITDGVPTRDVDTLFDEVSNVKNREIRIIGIGVTNNVNETLMRIIVTAPDSEHYFAVNDFDGLASILEKLIEETCRTLRPTPAPVVTAPPSQTCVNSADLAFILDASGSINQNNFNTMKKFVSDLVTDLEVDNDQVRVAVATFSDQVNPVFELDTYSNRLDMVEAINDISYTRGSTNTADALRYTRNTLFTQGNGARLTAPDVVVLISDGGSNNKRETIQQAYQAKAAGIHIITIGVGKWTDKYELIAVTSYPYERNKMDVEQFDALDSIRDNIRRFICNNINECDSNPCQNGGVCVDAIEHYWCRCPSGFAGVNCQTTCRTASDVTFSIDASGSIGRGNFQKELDFVRDVTLGLNLNGDTRVALETYANNPRVEFELNEHMDRLSLLNAMTAFYTGGTTNTAGALSEMRTQVFQSTKGDRSGAPNVGVFLTDGRSNDEKQTWLEAKKARIDDISLIAIGIGNNYRQRELDSIASPPYGENVYSVANFDDLSGTRDRIIESVCNDFDECASNPCGVNGNCIDLINGYECECSNGFSGLQCERGCSSIMDLIFVIDASGSIRNERFPKVVDFIVSVIDELDVAPDRTRVGALKFSDNTLREFDLNTHDSKQDVIIGMKHILFMGGRTNTASALAEMKDNMFKQSNGDRDNAPNRVVILTDGNSNLNEDATLPNAIDARVKGDHIIVVGVGTDMNILEMSGIASDPAEKNVFTVGSWKDLPNIKSSLVSALCDDTDECNNSPCRNGNCLDELGRYWCQCQFDWTGDQCDRRCTRQMDVALVLDLSGSIQEVYDVVLRFARLVIRGLPVDSGRARVALVTYRDQEQVRFYLDSFQSSREVMNAVVFSRTGGRTNTRSGIRALYNNVFVSNRGDRTGADNIGIVVSDGKSNVNAGQTIGEANNARGRNIELYSVATGDNPDMNEINGIANDPDSEHVVRMRNAGEVDAAAAQLLDLLC